MKTVLVTGGAGFVGSHVVDLLIENGYRCVVVDNLSTGYKTNLNKNAVLYKVDTCKGKELRDVFLKEKPAFVVHSAAQVQVVKSVEDPVHDASINIIGGINLLECCKEFKVKKIVYLCTGGALYGEPEYLPADEEHPVLPISPYGASKHSFELYLYLYKYNFGLDFVSLRFSNVYGPRDDVKSGRVIPNFVNAMLKNKQPWITGDGSQGRDFIYVLDVAEACLLALEKNPSSKFLNIGTEKVISVNEIFKLAKRLTGVRMKPKYVPRRAGEVQQIYLKSEKARKELGWKPKYEIEGGLKEYVAWLKR